MAGSFLLAIQPVLNRNDIGRRAVADEGLLALEQPLAVVLARRTAQQLGVGAGLRLGDGQGNDLAASGHHTQQGAMAVIADVRADDEAALQHYAAEHHYMLIRVTPTADPAHDAITVTARVPQGQPLEDAAAPATLLYKPWGGHAPAGNYLVSDSDFVEVLTEIDIQTPIPVPVQQRRRKLGFVFLGCRFDDQLPRAFARQILKRSAGPHVAVLPDTPTRMEARFLAEQGITRIALPLRDVAHALTHATATA